MPVFNDSTHHPLFKELNPEQHKAAIHINGPLLILAGAGSGKTRALTHRIAHLIGQGVPPWHILAVTFTNKAADEMKERISNLLHIKGTSISGHFDFAQSERQSKMPIMGTFHSICARILRRDINHIGRDKNFVIYDADDQQKLMKHVLKDMNIEESQLKARAALSHIGRLKCEAIGPKEAKKEATTERTQRILQAFDLYQKKLRESGALDFDDLILETIRLFRECPDVLKHYQNTWKYLNVDEYQDTNHAQYIFISLLAQSHRNLCVIGDPDQSIYAFRGADIRNILEFRNEYKDAKEIKLERNYRSTQIILTAADNVIASNPNRPQKRMWTDRNDGPKIIMNEMEDERGEAIEAVKSIKTLRASGTPLKDQAILYRTNAQSRLFEEVCMQEGIPYRIVGGLKFYARREVKDVLAYLHVILNPLDTVSILRIINIPPRKIGQTTLEKIYAFGRAHSLSLWETLRAASFAHEKNIPHERIASFIQMIDMFRQRATQVPVSTLTRELLDEIHLETWLRDDTEEGETRWQNVLELFSVMQKHDEAGPLMSLERFLEEAALVSEVDRMDSVSRDALTLMTIHLVKGLEFEHVIIAGCEEGIFPHTLSMFDREQLEEERRLMYVGMTRAKTHLQIFYARNRLLWGKYQQNPPSRFLEDIPDEVIEKRNNGILSAFAWSAKNHDIRHTFKTDDRPKIDIEFNQDWGD